MDFSFYKLDNSLEDGGAKSLVPFVNKVISLGKKVLILTSNMEEANVLNAKLWSSSGSEDFITHVIYSSKCSEEIEDFTEEEDILKNEDIFEILKLVIVLTESDARFVKGKNMEIMDSIRAKSIEGGNTEKAETEAEAETEINEQGNERGNEREDEQGGNGGFDVLFLVGSLSVDDISVEFLKENQKLCYFFTEEDVDKSRNMWKMAKSDDDFNLKFFTQLKNGKWE